MSAASLQLLEINLPKGLPSLHTLAASLRTVLEISSRLELLTLSTPQLAEFLPSKSLKHLCLHLYEARGDAILAALPRMANLRTLSLEPEYFYNNIELSQLDLSGLQHLESLNLLN